jgi:SNF family Na+-dependent transporter
MKKTSNRHPVGRLVRAIGRFPISKMGGQARLLLYCLLALMVGINGMTVANSCIGRWFTSTIKAVTGILMFGWSTGVLFSVVNHMQERFKSP